MKLHLSRYVSTPLLGIVFGNELSFRSRHTGLSQSLQRKVERPKNWKNFSLGQFTRINKKKFFFKKFFFSIPKENTGIMIATW